MGEISLYNFKWDELGDIGLGRPNLGTKTDVAVYRLMQYTMRAVLNQKFGVVKTNEIFFDAGFVAGSEFCKNLLDTSLELDPFVADLHQKLLQLGIGILHVESADSQKMSFMLAVSEDLDCSGLPVSGETVCNYDEGFIAGIFYVYTGKIFQVKEIDCWATGGRTCRFSVNQSE